jgi:NTE family protein
MVASAAVFARASCFLLALCAAPQLASAQTPSDDALNGNIQEPHRPRIGLVLGGGGAKGAAHVGVLRILEDLKVPVDCIVGTSMGALVGGTFAAGSSAAEIERDVLAIDWSRTVGNQGLRQRTPISRKLSELTYSNSLELGVSIEGIHAPGALISTQEIEGEIRHLVKHAQFVRNFDNLPIPFRAIATDMVSGEMVILNQGDLSVAMRASMAIPGAFAPVVIDDRVLADGGMVRNLPIDVARNLCADIVIAVWLTSPPPAPQDISSAFSLVGRSLDVMIEANERLQIASLASTDVGIEVPMGDIGSQSFDRVDEAIDLGKAAAVANSAILAQYAVSPSEYLAWRQASVRSNPHVQAKDAQTLAEVRVVGLHRVDPKYVLAQLKDSKPGATVTLKQIERDTERVFALDDFERVEYRLSGPNGQRVLEIQPVEKALGPNFLRIDFGLSTNFEGDLLGVLRVDHTQTWINGRGGRWHNAAQIGVLSLLSTDFYQPIDMRQRLFVQPLIALESDRQDIYDDGNRIAEYFLRQLYGQVDVGVNIGTSAQARIGLRRGWFEFDLDTGPPFLLPELDPEVDTNVQARFIYDTRDAVGLPTRGTFLNTRLVNSQSWLGGEQNYELVEGVLAQAFDVKGNSLTLILGGANTLRGEVAVTQQIQLGGIETFPGLQLGQLRGDGYWYAGTSYSWRLLDLQPLFGQSMYAGLRYQAGEVQNRIDQVDEGTLHGVAGSLSGRTPLGPFLLSLGFVDNGSWLLQFSLGRPITEGSMLDAVH